MIIFEAEPDRYGRFGHQFYRHLTAIICAEIFNGSFLLPRFRYFANSANQIFQYSSHPLCTATFNQVELVYLLNHPTDVYGNDKYALEDPYQICRFISDILLQRDYAGDRDLLIKLPFDQHPGLLLHYLSLRPQYQKRLATIYKKPKSLYLDSKHPRISIHIRRGDVNKGSFPSWYIEDRVYDSLIFQLLQNLESSHIYIHVQGSIFIPSSLHHPDAHLRLHISNSSSELNHADEINDLHDLFNADLIIGGQSSFSQAPALVCSIPFVEVYNTPNRQHQPHAFTPDLSISSSEIIVNARHAARQVLALIPNH